MSRKKDYSKYLHSQEWIDKREKVRKERKVCEICQCKENLQVHHLSYENIGNEKDEELILLCKECHYAIHRGVYLVVEGISGITFSNSELYDPFLKALNTTKISRLYFPKDKVLIARNICVIDENGKIKTFENTKWAKLYS